MHVIEAPVNGSSNYNLSYREKLLDVPRSGTTHNFRIISCSYVGANPTPEKDGTKSGYMLETPSISRYLILRFVRSGENLRMRTISREVVIDPSETTRRIPVFTGNDMVRASWRHEDPDEKCRTPTSVGVTKLNCSMVAKFLVT